MFLFLSKLLPLFLYPLGLSCLLMVLGILLLLFKKPRRVAALPILLALCVILLSSNGWVSTWLVRSLETQYRPTDIPTADAIVVLGGATKSAFSPRPWVEVNEEGDRVLYGAKLYRDGKAPKVILSGGRIEWDQSSPVSGKSESEDMAELMQTMGVPATAILEDRTSLNTRENALNVQQLMQQNRIQRILLVTSALHMPRSMMIFRKLGIEPIPAPTDFLVADKEVKDVGNGLQSIVLNLLPEAERMRGTTRALKEYLGIVVYQMRGWA